MLNTKGKNQYFQLRYLKAYLICFAISFIKTKYNTFIVRNDKEREIACKLLYKEYRKRKYCEEKPDQKYTSQAMLRPTSRTFALKVEDKICGTVSLIPDGPEGLPLECLYKDEVAKFRKMGARIAEVGLLALDTNKTKGYSLASAKKMMPLFSLFKAMTIYAITRNITHLVIVVNPKHRKLYDFFGFKQFGEVKAYEGVRNAPALPLILDLSEAVKKSPSLVKRYFLGSGSYKVQNTAEGLVFNTQT